MAVTKDTVYIKSEQNVEVKKRESETRGTFYPWNGVE